MEDERKDQFEQLYSFGIEWIARIENDLRTQDAEIKNLKNDNNKYRKLEEGLKNLMDNLNR